MKKKKIIFIIFYLLLFVVVAFFARRLISFFRGEGPLWGAQATPLARHCAVVTGMVRACVFWVGLVS